jgi:hypothetical protein
LVKMVLIQQFIILLHFIIWMPINT